MKRKVRFFRSVNFKIAITFILILLISIEIIGAYFIRGLERSTINTFIKDMNQTVESLATTISPELNRKDNADDEEVNANIKRFIENSATSDIIEIRVVDEKGIIRGTTDVNEQSAVGKKNDYVDINDFTTKRYVALDNDDKRVNINVQPILSPTGDAVIGALYVKSNIEQKYSEINNTAVIFFTASLIAAFISMIVSVLVARSITQPIGEMREQAIRIARGDYSRKVKVHGQDELGQLADTFNQLAERIEEAQDTMEAERNRLDSVLSHMTDGVIATDRRGKVITINDMAISLLDIKNEEAIGQSILTLLDIEEEYTLRKLLEDPNEMVLDRSTSTLESDQMILRVDFSMIRRESGFISGLVAVLHDVIRMINDLLNLSRMDTGNTQLQLEYVNFNELVNFVLDRFDMMVGNQEKNYKIRREFTQRDLWVEVDTDKIIQVVDNIMNNAIKYSPDGGTITCRLLETHNNVILSITDQGLGIPKKDLNRVFERFYRVDKARARAQGGTGLGLAISREVIKAHRGAIWAESKEGKGSTFYISLPYEPYEEEWWE